MDYAIDYDIGEQKRDRGINEDSVAIAVFEEGHREGLVHETASAADGARAAGEPADPTGAEADDEEDSIGTDATGTDSTGTDSTGTDSTGTEADSLAGAGDDGRRATTNRSTAVFALADGAGGHEAGDVASYLASTVVCERLAETAIRATRADPEPFGIDVRGPLPAKLTAAECRDAVAEAIAAAHEAVLEYAADAGQAAYTTVVAGLAVDGHLHYGWVGDSRAYVCNRTRDTVDRLTADHAVVAKLAEAGEIDDVEAMVHPRGNEITRALGGSRPVLDDDETIEVDTNTVDLYGDDVVLVTSDGLVDAQTDAPSLYDEYVDADRSEDVADEVREAVVTETEIRDLVVGADSLDDAATSLVALANDRGGKDNISTLLFGDPALPPAPESPPPRDIQEAPPIEDRNTLIVTEE